MRGTSSAAAVFWVLDIMFRFRFQRSSLFVRVPAAAMFAMYMLASFRGLIPGVCATLESVTKQPSGTCCLTRAHCAANQKSGPIVVQNRLAAECALCNLVESLAPPVANVSAPTGSTATSALELLPEGRLPESPASRDNAGRAPPLVA
jgi:hypothetical protein